MTDESKEIIIEQMDSMRAELMKAHEAMGMIRTHLGNMAAIALIPDMPTQTMVIKMQDEILEINNIIKRV